MMYVKEGYTAHTCLILLFVLSIDVKNTTSEDNINFYEDDYEEIKDDKDSVMANLSDIEPRYLEDYEENEYFAGDEQEATFTPREAPLSYKAMGPIIGESIYGKCKKKRKYLDIVIAQGGSILYYHPWDNYFRCMTLRVMEYMCTKVRPSGRCKGEMQAYENEIYAYLPAGRGWCWMNGRAVLTFTTYGFYYVATQQRVKMMTVFNVQGAPPTVEKVVTTVGPGFVWVYIWQPASVRDGLNLLGYRVSFLDRRYAEYWDPYTFVEQCVYNCDYPTLRPQHPCPRWRSDRVICILVTEPVVWTNNGSGAPAEKKFIKVESYYLSVQRIRRWYGMPYIVDIYGGHSRYDFGGDMFGAGNSTKLAPYSALCRYNYIDYLWLILLILCCIALVAGIPLMYYMASRAGHREAERIWRDWAESPGNLAVGLGGDTIAWQGQPPWKYRG